MPLASKTAAMRVMSPRPSACAVSRRLTGQAGGLGDMTRIASVFETSGIELDDLGLARPSLDDVFLHLTGRRAEAQPGAEDTTDASTDATPEGATP